MAKTRSPNYPVLPLGDALEAMRPVFKAENRNKMSRKVLAKHLGYSSLNGRALGKIGAVRAYGLIDGAGDELRVSDDAIVALASPAEHARSEALARLAFKPQLFQDIRKDYPETLPSEDNLRFWLVQRQFTEDAAEKAAKTYLATMRLVNGESGGYNRGTDAEEPVMTPGTDVKQPPRAGQSPLAPRPGMLQEVFTLEEGPVTLTFPNSLSAASYADLKDYFDLFLRKAKRQSEKRADEDSSGQK